MGKYYLRLGNMGSGKNFKRLRDRWRWTDDVNVLQIAKNLLEYLGLKVSYQIVQSLLIVSSFSFPKDQDKIKITFDHQPAGQTYKA